MQTGGGGEKGEGKALHSAGRPGLVGERTQTPEELSGPRPRGFKAGPSRALPGSRAQWIVGGPMDPGAPAGGLARGPPGCLKDGGSKKQGKGLGGHEQVTARSGGPSSVATERASTLGNALPAHPGAPGKAGSLAPRLFLSCLCMSISFTRGCSLSLLGSFRLL